MARVGVVIIIGKIISVASRNNLVYSPLENAVILGHNVFSINDTMAASAAWSVNMVSILSGRLV